MSSRKFPWDIFFPANSAFIRQAISVFPESSAAGDFPTPAGLHGAFRRMKPYRLRLARQSAWRFCS
jgi:hypothetical protein